MHKEFPYAIFHPDKHGCPQIPPRQGGVLECRMVRSLWQPPWDTEHINVLELRAIYLALRALLPFIQAKHVLVRIKQFCGCLLCQSSGRNKVYALPQDDQEAPLLGIPAPGLAEGSIFPGGSEPGSRPSLQVGASPRRVAAPRCGDFGVAQADLFASRETAHCQRWFSLNHPSGRTVSLPPKPRMNHWSNRISSFSPTKLRCSWPCALLRE